MSAYATPAAFREALERRLLDRARQTDTNLERLRRRVVFERLLVRLERAEPGRWILKGGMALEVRLGEASRMTRDLDLVVRAEGEGGDALRERLSVALGSDPDGDRFVFAVGEPSSLAAVQEGDAGWRYAVDVTLAERLFGRVSIDVVPRVSEVAATERIGLPDMLGFAGIPTTDIEVVERTQHFAEKLHALTRDYGAPNSRVRDLVDLVILVDDGLEPTAELYRVIAHVFETRGTHPIPSELPDPPAAWVDDFATRAKSLDISARTLDAAMTVLRAFWARVREDAA